MTIQELDAQIFHRAGKHNTNEDVFSLAHLQQSVKEGEESCETVAAIQPGSDLPALIKN